MSRGKGSVRAGGQPFGSGRVAAFGMGSFANSLYLTLFGVFGLAFLVDTVGIDPGRAGSLLFVALSLGALTNLIVGIMASRTSTAYGRYRPYLLYGSPLLAAAVLLCFVRVYAGAFTPFYYFTTLLLYAVAYTFVNVPYMSLTAAVTTRTAVITRLSSSQVVAGSIGTLIIYLAFRPVVDVVGAAAGGYAWAAGGVALLALGGHLLAFGSVRELVNTGPPPSAFSWSQVRSVLALNIYRNRPLLHLYTAYVPLLLALGVRAAFFPYLVKYGLGNESYFPYLGGLQIGAVIVGSALAPGLIRKYSRRQLLVACGLAEVISHALITVLVYWFSPLTAASTWQLAGLGAAFFGCTLLVGPILVIAQTDLARCTRTALTGAGGATESVVYGVSYLVFKVAQAAGPSSVGWLLLLLGISSRTVPSAPQRLSLVLVALLVPAALAVLSVGILYRLWLREKT